MKPFLSVIIPSYNEITNLRKGVLDKISDFLSKQSYTYEVIVVDDGSGDQSANLVDSFIKEHESFKLLKNHHLGKAGAVTSGMLKASGEYRLFMDMDQATPINEIDKLLKFTKKDFDIVIGSRKSNRTGAPLTRLIMARGMIILRKLLVGLGDINDTQCGFKLFKQDASIALFSKVKLLHNGFKDIKGSSVAAGFDIEILFLAEKLGYKIKEIPVDWTYVETKRVNPIKDSIEGLIDLFKIKMNNTLGKYK